MTSGYVKYLEAAGIRVFSVDGCFWQDYKGVMIPAYLPHSIPLNISGSAAAALKMSGAMLARWTEKFEDAPCSEWWYVLRDGGYSKNDLSTNTRSKLSRGMRRLDARPVSADALLREGYSVCVAASRRHGTAEFLPSRDDFERRVRAARDIPGVVEFWGVYRGEKLIAFSENHIQDGGVFMESIWYDPDGLRDYSSYLLMDAILDEYLGRRKFKYVSDGSRSIYHETGVHDFLIEKFGYRKAKARLKICYAPILGKIMPIMRGMVPVVAAFPMVKSLRAVRRFDALVLQDQISRDY